MADPLATQNLNKLYPANFRFDVARCPYFSLNVQAVTIPSLTLGESQLPTPLVDIPIPGDKIIYGEMTVDFVVDEEIRGWMEIHNWMRSAGFPESTDEYEKNVYADCFVTILSNAGNPIIKVSLFDCYPTSLGEISFNAQQSNETVISSASFRFRSYDVTPISSSVEGYETINTTIPLTS